MAFEPQNLTLELDFAKIAREVAGKNHNVMIKKNTNFQGVQPGMHREIL